MSQPTVAILGASADPAKFGNKSVLAHLAKGYQVFPVNVRGGKIEGLPVHERLSDVPVDLLDRISVYLPPAIGMAMLDEIAAKPCRELWFNPGSESDELLTKARSMGLDPIVACSIVEG